MVYAVEGALSFISRCIDCTCYNNACVSVCTFALYFRTDTYYTDTSSGWTALNLTLPFTAKSLRLRPFFFLAGSLARCFISRKIG